MLLALCAGGCGLSDHFSQLPIPASWRYEQPPQVGPDFPDVIAITRAHGRKLFPHAPARVEVSTPLYDAATRIYAVCARVNDGSGQPTMIASILRAQLADRRRAEAKDGCAGLDFTPVDVD